MNHHSSIKSRGSLLERAAANFDLAEGLRRPAGAAVARGGDVWPDPITVASTPIADAAAPRAEPFQAPVAQAFAPIPQPPVAAPAPVTPAPVIRSFTAKAHGTIDHLSLQENGFIEPDAPPTGLAEEFRIVKRHLLLGAARDATLGRMMLVCSAQPDEGKTFCAINLALSLAGEQDLEVLLVDSDFAKPEVLSTLGLQGGAGIMDAIVDPSINVEDLIIQTDIPNLMVLAAGCHSNEATEMLASKQAKAIFASLLQGYPNRVVICDSAPALAASTASVMAMHAGQTLMVVRADKTSEAEIREALGLLRGCPNIQLLLNGVTFSPNGRRFGAYYGYGD